MNSLISIIGILAVLTSAIRLIPQIVKCHKYKSVRDVSFTWEFVGAFGSALWVWYGLLITDSIVIYGGVIVLASYMVLMYQHTLYN